MIKKLFYILLAVIIIGSCKGKRNGSSSGEFDIPDSVKNSGRLEISADAMDDIVQNIASPVEMAALIKNLGVPFSRKYLSTTDYVNEYNTAVKKAYNLGVFGADLGYLNMYNKTSSVVDYITAIKSLADGISVGQFFDFNNLKRLATSSNNLDSLMYNSVHSFNEMDNYLRKNKRSNLSAVIVAGVWMEGLYLATQVAKEYPSPDLAESIGQQKNVLTQLMLILKNFQNDPEIVSLVSDLSEVKKAFDPVTITVEVGDPQTVEKNGKLTIVQSDTQVVHITDAQLKSIISQIEKIRNKLIRS
jgi:hypothetical protein